MAIKKGIYAASMSIFNQDLSLDIDSTIKHSEKLIKVGLARRNIFWIYWIAHNLFLQMRKKN